MRVRNLLTTLAAATLLIGLGAAPASAGTGPSTYCSDGVGWQGIQVLSWPVAVGVEVFAFPGGSTQSILLCYSTNPAGTPGGLTGGALFITVATDTGTAYPGATVSLVCHPDAGIGVGPTCSLPTGVNVAPGDVAVTAPNSSICIVSIGAGCVAYVPGVKVATGGSGFPTVGLQILGIPLPVDLPPQCVAVVVTCP